MMHIIVASDNEELRELGELTSALKRFEKQGKFFRKRSNKRDDKKRKNWLNNKYKQDFASLGQVTKSLSYRRYDYIYFELNKILSMVLYQINRIIWDLVVVMIKKKKIFLITLSQKH